jgi:hypothetical protein
MEAWRRRKFVDSRAKEDAQPVLALEKLAAPTTDDEAKKVLAQVLGLEDTSDDRFEDLLGNPQAIYYIRFLAREKVSKLHFRNMSELYWDVTYHLIHEGIKKPKHTDPTFDERSFAQKMLGAIALEMCIQDPTSHVATGDSKIGELRQKVKQRFANVEIPEQFGRLGDKAWTWLQDIAVLTNRTLLLASSAETLAWPNRRMMEFYAGLYLASNEEPGWIRNPGDKGAIECGDEVVRRHAAHPEWLNIWRFAIEMPATIKGGPRKDRVLLASLSTLFLPVTQPKNAEEPWLRPSEPMWRAWCLLEELPRFERADWSSTLLAGGERVLAAFRKQFQDQSQSTDASAEIAKNLMEDFVQVPALDGTLKLMDGKRVVLNAFELGRTAVTREQFQLFDKAYLSFHAKDMSSYEHKTGDCPAGYISWYDAWVASRYFGCRLATEAEWEWACSAGSQTEYSRIRCWLPPFYRDLMTEKELSSVADFGRPVKLGPRPVRHGLLPNRFDLLGMHGGVWEWCGTWDGDHPTAEANPHGAERGSYRVFRGGSWISVADYCRTMSRLGYDPSKRDDDLGFRLARDPS